MCDTYMRVNENVRRVRQTIETRMFFYFSLVLQRRLCAFVKQHFRERRDQRQQHKED